MTYLADCQGPCSAFSGSTGDVWVKIHQAGYDPDRAAADGGTPWASKRLPEQNSTWTVALPATLRPGQYVLRHEILGLQRTNTDGNLAQFYPACHQIAVTGTGTAALPAGIALPGAYRPDDTTSVSFFLLLLLLFFSFLFYYYFIDFAVAYVEFLVYTSLASMLVPVRKKESNGDDEWVDRWVVSYLRTWYGLLQLP